ncbi:hypothetical protein, partial [[Eubacterium] cellulosolvens]
MFNKKVKSASEAFAALRPIFPSDTDFKNAFESKQEKNSRKARYVLEAIELQERRARGGGVAAGELRPSA